MGNVAELTVTPGKQLLIDPRNAMPLFFAVRVHADFHHPMHSGERGAIAFNAGDGPVN